MTSQAKEDEHRFLLQCIELYERLPALWKIKSSDYSNRNKKDNAYEQLLMKYREKYENATKEDVKKKFNALRTNFRKEMKKMNDSFKYGTEVVYVTNLWYFQAMSFLQDQETPAMSRSTIDSQMIKEEVEDQTEENTSTPLESTPTWKQNVSYKRKRIDKLDNLLSSACSRFRETDDSNLNMAKAWAQEISEMERQQQKFAKKAINDIIFEGQMGTLHRYSVQINASPQDSRSSTPFSSV